MKPAFKKSFHYMMAPILSISLLAGCSGGAPAAGGDTSAMNKASDSGAPAAKKAVEPLAMQFMVPSYADVPNMNDEYWSEWQKRTNSKLDIEWIPSGDYDTKFDLVLASGSLPEIMVATSATRTTLLNAIKQGAFWDLTPFLGDFSKYPNLMKNSGPNVWSYMKVDGKIYGMPRNRPQVDTGLKMRKDWLDKLNIPIPTTMDEYAAALKKIVDSDPAGNGKNNTIGLLTGIPPEAAVLTAFGAYDPVYDKEGGLVKENLTPNYTDALGFLRKLYADGVMAKEFSAIKSTQAEELFLTGRAASYVRNIWRDYSFEQEIKKVQPDVKVITLPPMKGPGGNSVFLSPPFFGALYISKKVPEAKVKQILDYMEKTTTMEYTDFNFFGIEGVHHKLVNGQPQLTELGVKQVTTNTNQVFMMAFNNKMKVINPAAPKAYNDAKLKETEVFSTTGKMNIFSLIYSDTWTSVWPKHDKEWQSMATKVVVGQITMEEYKAYVDKLNNMPEFKKAYQEFNANYKLYNNK